MPKHRVRGPRGTNARSQVQPPGTRNGTTDVTIPPVLVDRNGPGSTYLGVASQRQQAAPTGTLPAASTGRAVKRGGGRLTVDWLGMYFGKTPVVLPPPSSEADWSILNLDANTFSRLTPARVLTILADLSPDVSRALWDFLRLCNPGWAVTCFNVNSDEPNEQAQLTVDAFMDRLSDLYGSVDVVHGALFMGAFMRGALFSELVLDKTGRLAVDVATPDPHTARFKMIEDDVRGQVYQLCQWQTKGLIDLDRPTVRYTPIDKAPGSPYGRAMVAPALFASLFLLSMLHDLRRVLAQQGYPRIDLKVKLDQLLKEAPQDVQTDTEAFKAWSNMVFDAVQQVYESLEPDDAYVHSDAVEVGRPVGAADASSLGAVPGIIEVLERWLTRALKTMAITQGTRQGNSETQANREWEIQTAGIAAVQHLAETMWERHLEILLQAAGVQANVELRYAVLRASEELRDEQVRAAKIDNEFKLYAYNMQSLDAMALALVGHEAEGDVPRFIPTTWGQEAGPDAQSAGNAANPNPGENRQGWWPTPGYFAEVRRKARMRYSRPVYLRGLRPPVGQRGGPSWLHIRDLVGARQQASTAVVPKGANGHIPAVPSDVTPTRQELRAAVGTWRQQAPPPYHHLLDAEVVGEGT